MLFSPTLVFFAVDDAGMQMEYYWQLPDLSLHQADYGFDLPSLLNPPKTGVLKVLLCLLDWLLFSLVNMRTEL